MRNGDGRKARKGNTRAEAWRFLFCFIALSPLLPLSLSLVCLTAFAQLRNDRGWVWQNPLPQGNALYSIHFAHDNLTGFAVGDNRTILRTVDGGFTWESQTSPVDATLSAVFVRDERSAVIVGTRGTILLTDNAGKDWRPIDAGSRDHL